MDYFCDNRRHLVCQPYSVENLHRMAADLGLKRCWFHKDHYDVPVKRVEEIKRKCRVVRPREVLAIIKGTYEHRILETDQEQDCQPEEA